MTARITKAREGVLATVQMYAPVHAQFSTEALRRLNQALDEHHNAVVEATLAAQPQLPNPGPTDPEATSVVPLVPHDPDRQPDAVGDVTEQAPKELPSPADQAAGKPVKKARGSINKPAQ